MTVKKSYKVGDTVWIYGIDRNNKKPTQGQVIKIIDLSDSGYPFEHYIIEVPTHIEPILEIRTWHNISQDEKGPVGMFRTIGNIESTIKFTTKIGFEFNDVSELSIVTDTDDDEITAEQIHAALEKAQMSTAHQPLNLKEPKPAKRRFSKRKPKND